MQAKYQPFCYYYDGFDGADEQTEEKIPAETTPDEFNHYDTTETSEEFEHYVHHDECWDETEYGENDADSESGYDNDFTPTSPDDETAATSDGKYGDSTVWAQQQCALDDYEIISDVLVGEKQLVKLYSAALCESAEENLRDVIRENLIECAADQYSTFEYMQKRGMYPTEQAPEDKVNQAKQQFTPLCDNSGICD